jgi:SAM-dependent methyltransferase
MSSPDDMLGALGLDRAAVYDAFFSREYEQQETTAFLRWLFAETRLERPSILDAGCGTGRLFAALRALGEVTGLELDPVYAAAARNRGEPLGVGVLACSLLELSLVAAFDVVLLMNGPLVYLTQEDDRQDVICRIFRALRPGGLVFFDLPNFLYLLKNYREPQPIERMIGNYRFQRTMQHRLDPHHALWIHEETVSWEADKNIWNSYQELYHFSVITAPELFSQLGQAGFVSLQTFNHWADRESSPLSGPRIMVAAQKPITLS